MTPMTEKLAVMGETLESPQMKYSSYNNTLNLHLKNSTPITAFCGG